MKALWAYEPFHQDTVKSKEMYNLLKQLVDRSADIEFGFIVTRTEPELNSAYDVPFMERFTIYPLKIFRNSLRSASIPVNEKNIHVIDYKTFSVTKVVTRFLTLARSRRSDLIALYTHGHKGFMRYVVGSFAETAIHRSKIDLLVANQKTVFSPKIKAIFYATDFSPSSQKHFKKVIQICKNLGARLTIFHAAEIIYKFSLDESNPSIISYRKKINKLEDLISQDCKKAQVPCNIIITSNFNGATDQILKKVKSESSDLIVVSAKAGPFAALLGGSITRQIIRLAINLF